MLNQAAYENTRPDGFPVMEALDGWEGKQRHFVPLKRSTLSGTVAGPLASLRLTQVFGYRSAQCDKVLEAAYRFPLPGDAAVTAVHVRFGAVAIDASLQERRAAEKQYGEAKRRGKQAAIATRESVDVFTLRLAGIKPDEDVLVETDYVQLARPEGSGWSLRVPLTTAPRYVRSDERETPEAAGQPLALLRDPGHRFSLSLQFLAATALRSHTHRLTVASDGSQSQVALADGEVVPDRDLVLQWLPASEDVRPTLHVLGGCPPGDEWAYYLALVAPPAGVALPAVAQEAVLLVDHSGSMEGTKWQAADWAVRKFLLGLSAGSKFNLCLFHSQTLWFREAPVAADEDNVQAALRFLEDESSGGTELGVALEQALSQDRSEGVATRHVFVITDAEVSDAARILRLAEEESQQAARRRISVLCIDAAPNSYLAQELAARGGGVARFLTSAPEEDDITTALDAILEDWSQPILTGVSLEAEGEAGAVLPIEGSATGMRGSLDLGDMPSGRALWTVLRLPQGAPASFHVQSGGSTIAQAAPLDAGPTVAIAARALFGVRRVQALEHLAGASYHRDSVAAQLRALGYDVAARESHGTKLYAENQRRDVYELVRGLLVSESLYYGVASSATAFVAVRQEAGKPVEGTVVVANALPAGWSEAFLAQPAAAPPLRRTMGRPPAARSVSRQSAKPAFEAPMVADSGAFPEQAEAGTIVYRTVFQGVATTTGGEFVLFDSRSDPDAIAADATLRWLRLTYPSATPAAVDRGLELLLYVGDLSQPRARVRLADLLRQDGVRPLNLLRRGDEPVRLVLADANGAWSTGGPVMEVALAC